MRAYTRAISLGLIIFSLLLSACVKQKNQEAVLLQDERERALTKLFTHPEQNIRLAALFASAGLNVPEPTIAVLRGRLPNVDALEAHTIRYALATFTYSDSDINNFLDNFPQGFFDYKAFFSAEFDLTVAMPSRVASFVEELADNERYTDKALGKLMIIEAAATEMGGPPLSENVGYFNYDPIRAYYYAENASARKKLLRDWQREYHRASPKKRRSIHETQPHPDELYTQLADLSRHPDMLVRLTAFSMRVHLADQETTRQDLLQAFDTSENRDEKLLLLTLLAPAQQDVPDRAFAGEFLTRLPESERDYKKLFNLENTLYSSTDSPSLEYLAELADVTGKHSLHARPKLQEVLGIVGTKLPPQKKQFYTRIAQGKLVFRPLYVKARVSEVISGNTIIVDIDRYLPRIPVRLKNIESPDPDMPCFEEARDLTFDMVQGKEVSLCLSREEKSGVLIAEYVLSPENRAVHLALLRKGLAKQVAEKGKAGFQPYWQKLQDEARKKRLGIWSKKKT